ncbi:hypothetical protein Gogos_020534, partial [Gossypium gossypioides]|nr:hypothetical protein [Gossypium gossypioides]
MGRSNSYCHRFVNKVLSSIQLVEDVSYGRNINSSERNATKALSEVLVVQEIDMLGKIVGALSKFLSKEAKGLWAVRSKNVRIQGIPVRTSQNWGKLERRLLTKGMYQQMQ